MDVWFCEDRNHAERRLMRAEMIFRRLVRALRSAPGERCVFA